jgi:hypothetical protein
MTRPGLEPGPPRWDASDYPPELWHGPNIHFNVRPLALKFHCLIITLWGKLSPTEQAASSDEAICIRNSVWFESRLRYQPWCETNDGNGTLNWATTVSFHILSKFLITIIQSFDAV